ncbi:hypothetical protein PGTUg99_015644 [Puccinia graminis f. sp. tritici]|uniref:DUF7872 domain-containing protein n=2 Tax=Puccinia graminis f. sp. tritici TaxID=56615 RepID=A0A5B0QLD2_PUCGR|nr:hypothetical protein PGTUg99_015644 [Puccinia graminis f. sp. tritici]
MAISASMMEVSGTLAMDLMMIMGAATGPVGWTLNVLNFAAAAGFAIYAFKQKVPKGPIMEGFGVWTDVVFHLANVERDAHDALSNAVKKVINSPISSKDGIYGVLKGGTFMNTAKLKPIPEVADQLRKVTMAMSMNLVLRDMNAYIAVGADDCYDKGPNGAWPQKDLLSYCPKQGGPMYNIIRAVGEKSENNIPNANVINDIFGFPTQLIVDVSVDCQQRHGGFNHNPYVNGKFPKSEHDECVFNLPVCDARWGGVRSSIKKHHQHVTVACRKHGGLPI